MRSDKSRARWARRRTRGRRLQRALKRACGAHVDDTHPCHDCGDTYFERLGTYWLADDDLWDTTVRRWDIVLCPACFVRRAEAAGLPVRFVAQEDR